MQGLLQGIEIERRRRFPADMPANDPPVAGVDDEEHAHHVAVSAVQIEMVRAPSGVGA
jgi:hypothetical protein